VKIACGKRRRIQVTARLNGVDPAKVERNSGISLECVVHTCAGFVLQQEPRNNVIKCYLVSLEEGVGGGGGGGGRARARAWGGARPRGQRAGARVADVAPHVACCLLRWSFQRSWRVWGRRQPRSGHIQTDFRLCYYWILTPVVLQTQCKAGPVTL
jgi:hypothetical protein